MIIRMRNASYRSIDIKFTFAIVMASMVEGNDILVKEVVEK